MFKSLTFATAGILATTHAISLREVESNALEMIKNNTLAQVGAEADADVERRRRGRGYGKTRGRKRGHKKGSRSKSSKKSRSKSHKKHRPGRGKGYNSYKKAW